ncbi:hypothetical protein Patl1_23740 [Pistacia atlantica]|uniref:Uncharacterized protein n=1 Tax=Pistacia atlantica TaxID=434234 RepID=A0ACC0ZYV2_9ROSI|nr:hypothetical protein Patl1_23740 [Pistacia atlantica]
MEVEDASNPCDRWTIALKEMEAKPEKMSDEKFKEKDELAMKYIYVALDEDLSAKATIQPKDGVEVLFATTLEAR